MNDLVVEHLHWLSRRLKGPGKCIPVQLLLGKRLWVKVDSTTVPGLERGDGRREEGEGWRAGGGSSLPLPQLPSPAALVCPQRSRGFRLPHPSCLEQLAWGQPQGQSHST